MSLRAIEGRFTQMIAYFLVMNSKRCIKKIIIIIIIIIIRIRSDEGLTLETSAFNLFTAANLPYQLS